MKPKEKESLLSELKKIKSQLADEKKNIQTKVNLINKKSEARKKK